MNVIKLLKLQITSNWKLCGNNNLMRKMKEKFKFLCCILVKFKRLHTLNLHT